MKALISRNAAPAPDQALSLSLSRSGVDPSLAGPPPFQDPTFPGRVTGLPPTPGPIPDGEIVASFGAATLIHHHNGQWELRGGSAADVGEAREYCSLFEHTATFVETPAPTVIPNRRFRHADGARVLIADDDALVRGSLAAVLESEGFEVDEASDGREVVVRTVACRPDLVLLDLNMPHWDGWAAFRQLDRVAPLLPVIVITARPRQYSQAVQLGVDAFMEKPLNLPVLIDAIDRLTGEERKHRERRVTQRGFVTQLLSSAGI